MRNRPDVFSDVLLDAPRSEYRKQIEESIEKDKDWMTCEYHGRMYGPCGARYHGGDAEVLEQVDDRLSDLEARFAVWKGRVDAGLS